MKTNESGIDRIIRIVLAIVFGIVAYKTSGALSVVMWVLTAIAGITGIVGFCPLYRIFGIATRK
nr:DUF2892 domain-containing protein [Corynebacterium lactis]